MPTARKTCRVCGNIYEACRTTKENLGAFVWRDVACSPECGFEYLRRVEEARASQNDAEKPSIPTPPKPKSRGRKAKAEPEPISMEETIVESIDRATEGAIVEVFSAHPEINEMNVDIDMSISFDE